MIRYNLAKSEKIYAQTGRVSLILRWKYTWVNISFVIPSTPGA